jgi:hypothetical protein
VFTHLLALSPTGGDRCSIPTSLARIHTDKILAIYGDNLQSLLAIAD